MKDEEFGAMAERVTRELAGKTISHATWEHWGMSCSVTLHFTDKTKAEIRPEHDEGFVIESPSK